MLLVHIILVAAILTQLLLTLRSMRRHRALEQQVIDLFTRTTHLTHQQSEIMSVIERTKRDFLGVSMGVSINQRLMSKVIENLQNDVINLMQAPGTLQHNTTVKN